MLLNYFLDTFVWLPVLAAPKVYIVYTFYMVQHLDRESDANDKSRVKNLWLYSTCVGADKFQHRQSTAPIWLNAKIT